MTSTDDVDGLLVWRKVADVVVMSDHGQWPRIATENDVRRWRSHKQHCELLLSLPLCPDRAVVEVKLDRLKVLLRGYEHVSGEQYWSMDY